jgi:hypothetical protein
MARTLLAGGYAALANGGKTPRALRHGALGEGAYENGSKACKKGRNRRLTGEDAISAF